MIKFVFEWYAKKVEKLTKNNIVVKILLCIARYYIWCLDACVKFISENAYVQVAITGCTFCGGAAQAFYMLLRNPGLTAVQILLVGL